MASGRGPSVGRALLWAAGAGVCAAGAALVYVYPRAPIPYPICLTHHLTGLFCPGCGSLRAAHCLLHGELAAALRYNALAVAAAIVVPVELLWRRFPGVLPGLRRAITASPVPAWAALWALVLFTVARNLPWAPFCLLAPGAGR